MWCDHDYLNLPAGVTSVQAEAIDLFAGDADADYHDSLSSVWGDFTGALFEKAEEFGWGKIAAGAGIGVLAVVAVVLCIVFGKKKKDKTEAGE